jgi:ferredoxin-type protein NapH
VVLASVLLLTALGGAVIAPLFYPPAILARQLFRAVYFGGIGAGLTVVVLAFLLDTFVSRGGFCASLCPGGALFRVIGMFSPVRVQRDRAACEHCGSCDAICSLAQSPMTDRLDSGCERCGKCVAVCPPGALRITVGRPLARLVAGEETE